MKSLFLKSQPLKYLLLSHSLQLYSWSKPRCIVPLPRIAKQLHNHQRAMNVAIKAQSSNCFPISTSHTNISTEQLTFLTSRLGYNLHMSCRNRLMNGLGGISTNKAAVQWDLCILAMPVGDQPCHQVERQWENSVLIATDLASPQTENV